MTARLLGRVFLSVTRYYTHWQSRWSRSIALRQRAERLTRTRVLAPPCTDANVHTCWSGISTRWIWPFVLQQWVWLDREGEQDEGAEGFNLNLIKRAQLLISFRNICCSGTMTQWELQLNKHWFLSAVGTCNSCAQCREAPFKDHCCHMILKWCQINMS